MKKTFLIKNPEVFQGKKYLNKNKIYFEGWYFKNTNNKYSIAFIPGININKNEKNAFIQIITNNNSYNVNYDIDNFVFNHNPFYIKIKDNYFSKDKIHIDIEDNINNLIIKGDIKYSNNQNIKSNIINPNIMGPFSYIPFMECNHAILSMKNNIDGFIKINNKDITFNNDIGYIEKDWGYSFPKKYIWCQGNCFQNKNTSFMLSIANIPFKIFNFQGFICSLIIDGQEYRFATYNNAKIKKYEVNNNLLEIILKKGIYQLEINSKLTQSQKLLAPIKGEMKKYIYETLNATINITLKKEQKIIYSDTSKNCGLEIVN